MGVSIPLYAKIEVMSTVNLYAMFFEVVFCAGGRERMSLSSQKQGVIGVVYIPGTGIVLLPYRSQTKKSHR